MIAKVQKNICYIHRFNSSTKVKLTTCKYSSQTLFSKASKVQRRKKCLSNKLTSQSKLHPCIHPVYLQSITGHQSKLKNITYTVKTKKINIYWLGVLFQRLNQHLLKGWNVFQVCLNVTDVNTAESAEERRGESRALTLMVCQKISNTQVWHTTLYTWKLATDIVSFQIYR